MIELRQHLKLTQQLIMTPQLQQSIKLLQLSRLELITAINQELEENPLLEEPQFDDETDGGAEAPEVEALKIVEKTKEITGEGDGKEDFDWDNYLEDYGSAGVTRHREDSEAPAWENMLSRTGTLTDHLLWQLRLSNFSDEEESIAEQIIGNLDAKGYLRATIEEIANIEQVSAEMVEEALAKVQEFDPPGIAARDLQECLMLQLQHMELQNPLVQIIIKDHLKDLETKNYQNIVRKQKVTIDEIRIAVQIINSLDPKPGLFFNEEKPQYVVPDVYVFKMGNEYRVTLNEDGLPRLRISNLYREILGGISESSRTDECRDYVKERLQSATWLIKSIQQRQRTIFRVAESIVKHQREYFDKGIDFLKPMVLRDIAEDVGMHESTISRVTTNKYMHTPRGTYELKYFFNSGINRTDGDMIASESVKEMIKHIADIEDKCKPLSDSQILDMLKKSGISIARRTVAKYREALGILPSSKRKKYF
ncbi:MAG: RNA polymerase factor sigma-54 [Deltaproteobacteria bacterium]|nr:RNA polymerase factor sigma-54 [Deltaproteobacteria bacterium]